MLQQDPHGDVLRSQLNAGNDNTDNKNYSEEFENANEEYGPFTIRSTEQGHFLTIGPYAVMPPMKTKDEAKTLVGVRDWDLILNVICAVATSIWQQQRNEDAAEIRAKVKEYNETGKKAAEAIEQAMKEMGEDLLPGDKLEINTEIKRS